MLCENMTILIDRIDEILMNSGNLKKFWSLNSKYSENDNLASDEFINKT